MARLMAVADGNNTSASTWALIDSTSFLESETSSITVPTSYATGYTTFTPGVITIDGIAVRLSNRAGTTGTFSVELYNNTLGASVAGTEVTINTSDFVDGTTTPLDGGWYFFKFAAPVLLVTATAYFVRFKTSSASQITLFGASSTAPNRFVRTTTTKAPATGDDRFILGEWTAATTTTTRTVTLDDTGAAIDYGSAFTTLVNPALSISAGGIVLAGTTASTTYVQKISGVVVVYNGGILRLGTSGGRMPTTSSFTWTFDCAANVGFGIVVRRKGEFSAYGATKKRWTLLTGDEAAAQTVIGVVDTTGWVNGDSVVLTGTGTTTTHFEVKTVSTVDSSTQITLTTGTANARTGTGDVIGEVGNLSSNVNIVGASASLNTYITFFDSSIGYLDNVKVQFYGSASGSKRGVESQHISSGINSFTAISCAFVGGAASSTVGLIPATGNNAYITDCVFQSGNAYTGLTITSNLASPSFDFSRNCIVGAGNITGILVSTTTGPSGIISDNIISGATTGISVTTSPAVNTITALSGHKIHSSATAIQCSTAQKKIFTSFDMVSNNVGLGQFAGSMDFISCNFFGNATAGMSLAFTSTILSYLMATSCAFRGRSGFAQNFGYSMGTAFNGPFLTVFNSCTFGVTTAHATADINITALFCGKVVLNNCTLASTNDVNSIAHTLLDENASISLQRINTTAANHRTHVKQAIITPDTVIYRTASPSLRITPKSASIPCSTSLFTFKVPINSGQTCTPTVYVRESETGDGAVYNGSRVKLYVKANYNLGITSDTLLDTATAASDGAFEALTGTTATVTDAGVLEFYLVCDGTAGWINVDDFTATNA